MERTKRAVRPPKQERSRKMVARILDSAAALFLERGYDLTTTNHIADHAEISIGSLYQFFPDKSAILTTLQTQWADKLHLAMDAALAGEAADLPWTNSSTGSYESTPDSTAIRSAYWASCWRHRARSTRCTRRRPKPSTDGSPSWCSCAAFPCRPRAATSSPS